MVDCVEIQFSQITGKECTVVGKLRERCYQRTSITEEKGATSTFLLYLKYCNTVMALCFDEAEIIPVQTYFTCNTAKNDGDFCTC